jgi:hypothetical protein
MLGGGVVRNVILFGEEEKEKEKEMEHRKKKVLLLSMRP